MINDEKDEKLVSSKSPFDMSDMPDLSNLVNQLPHGHNLPITTAEQKQGDEIAKSYGLIKDGVTTIPRKRRSDLPKKHMHMLVELPYAEWFLDWTLTNRYTYEEGLKILIDFYKKQSE